MPRFARGRCTTGPTPRSSPPSSQRSSLYISRLWRLRTCLPAEATRLLARTTTIALTTSAILAPLIGAIADHAPIKKRLLGLFTAIGCIAAGCLVMVHRHDWLLAAVLFGIGNVGVTTSLTLYDSLLPHIAREDEIDRISTAGFGLGYLGGGLLLALNVAWILSPSTFGLRDAGQASRLSFLSVALWWAVFSIPLFRRVPEPKVRVGQRRSLNGRADAGVICWLAATPCATFAGTGMRCCF